MYNIKIKNFTVLLFWVFLPFLLYTQSSGVNDKIIGTWLMPDDEGIIEICKDDYGVHYKGKILWMKARERDGSPLRDKKIPLIA